jgi:hypothetical protein
VFDGTGNLAEDSVLVQVVPTWSEILAAGWGLVLALVDMVSLLGYVSIVENMKVHIPNNKTAAGTIARRV